MAASAVDVIDVEAGERAGDASVEAVLREELAVGVRGGGEAARHADAELRELAQHLAERGILAADAIDVLAADFIEGNDVIGHGAATPL